MDIREAVSTVESSEVFRKKGFLAHAFVMLEAGHEDWQLGYFDEKTDRMLGYALGEHVAALPPAEVLKKGPSILPLDASKVAIAPEEALAIARKRCKRHALKTFFIIQHLAEGQVYNVTFVTHDLRTVNLHISCVDGKVFHESDEPLIAKM